MIISRRQFIAGGAAVAAASRFPRPAVAAAKAKIVVVGGGVGGASIAAKLSKIGGFDITLVEPNKIYTSCFMSNHFLGGLEPLDVLRHDYAAVGKRPGVTVAAERAAAIDRARRRVTLAGGAVLDYDRLVVAPGISLDYGAVPGWSEEAETRMPHGWEAGEQTLILKRQLDAVPDGGLIVVIPPPPPARCPPAPYERVSMMAHALKSTGRGRARIIIVDPKEKFSKQALFQQAWERHFPGMIEWLPPMIHAGVKHVDAKTMTVETDFETYKGAAMVNVIPAHRAGRIAIDAGLTDASGYCPIDVFTMKSRLDGSVFVLGDAALTGKMPRSASAASGEADIAAAVIAAELLGRDRPNATYRTKCWSQVAVDDSVFVIDKYRPTDAGVEKTGTEISRLEDDEIRRRTNAEESRAWHIALTNEMFG
ncbi:MAG: FAD-dependent oxidoreductase [Rhodospirillaceae bacterium]